MSAAWRVSAEHPPIAGGPSINQGPVNCLFNPQTDIGTERTVSFSIAIPADAAPGTYRVIIDHYDKVDEKWVHIRYLDAAGKPHTSVLGEIEIVPPLVDLPLPAPLRKLRAGEIQAVYEAEDFLGMDGGGEDLATAAGWTWYTYPLYSGRRAAVNTTGSGVIHMPLDPPLPPGDYKLFVRAGALFSTVRLTLAGASTEGTPLRVGWNEAGSVTTTAPADRLDLEAVRKLGRYIIIDAVYITNDASTQATAGLNPSRQFLPHDAHPAKSSRSVWTADYMAGVKHRLERHESLRKAAEDVIAEGRRIAQHSDQQLWELMADTSIKREYYVNQHKGCPVCGLKIKEFDVGHPWILDPLKYPYKMQCPVCKRRFPSNDFAAGEMTGGEYPDDGTGCKIGDDTYHFIGEYVHWAYRTYYKPYLRSLMEATVLSDDAAIAHKLGVMLLRAAQQWPNSEDRYPRSFRGKPGYNAGAFTDWIWSSYAGRSFGCAYDAVWPFLNEDDALLELARREIPEIQTHEDLRLYIEENLLRRIGQQYCDGGIQGNAGYHHAGMAWLLLALGDMDSDRFPNCRDLLEFLYYRIYGPVRYLPNLLGRDGCGHESTGYNASRLNMLKALSITERFFAEQGQEIDRARYPSLWHDPRFAAQFDYYTDYMLLDRWLPAVGDATGGPVIPERRPPHRYSIVSPKLAVGAWERYRTARLAVLAYGYDNTPPQPSLWEDHPLDELAAARSNAPARVTHHSGILDDYGLAFLRSGSGDDARVLWAWYGKLVSHAHDDKLLYGLCGHGLDLLPDLGYPKSWKDAGRWEANSLTHNTMTVDGSAFPPGWHRGRLKLLGTVPGSPPPLQLAEVEIGDMTGAGEVSRRLLALVDVDDRDFYAVDLFDVRAGKTHTLSYHGPQGEVTVRGLELQQQAGGTVAGRDIEYGQAEGERDGKPIFSPLGHMTDVVRAHTDTPFSVDYALGDELDTHVRLRHFPDAATDVAFGTGRPPSHPDAYRVRYCLQTRRGESPLSGRYLTLAEPWAGREAVSAARRLQPSAFGQPELLRVDHGDTYDLLMLAPDARVTMQAEGVSFTGRAALVRHAGDAPTEVVAYAFTSLQAAGLEVTATAPYLSGSISSCDYDAWTIVVPGIPVDAALVGQPVRIYNDLHSTMHIISEVRAAPAGTQLKLSTTAIRHDGWCSTVADATVRDGAPSPWAMTTFMAGTRLVNEAGDREWMVYAASGGWGTAPTGTCLNVRETDGATASQQALRAGLGDSNADGISEFRLYDYGTGDRIEISVAAWLTRGEDGRWGGVLSPGCQMN